MGLATLANCTLSGNTAGTGTGGGIALGAGHIAVFNTLVAGNTAGSAADVGGTVNSLGHNLIGIGAGGGGYADTDLVGTPASPLDPKLGPLQDNGGPTQTMALLPGSPAIDAGAPSDSEWDQRGPGYPRSVNGATDTGAYEVQEPGNPGRGRNAVPLLLAATPVAEQGRSSSSTPALASAETIPSRWLRPAVAATDRLFALLFVEPTRLALPRFRHVFPEEAGIGALLILPTEVVA